MVLISLSLFDTCVRGQHRSIDIPYEHLQYPRTYVHTHAQSSRSVLFCSQFRFVRTNQIKHNSRYEYVAYITTQSQSHRMVHRSTFLLLWAVSALAWLLGIVSSRLRCEAGRYVAFVGRFGMIPRALAIGPMRCSCFALACACAWYHWSVPSLLAYPSTCSIPLLPFPISPYTPYRPLCSPIVS